MKNLIDILIDGFNTWKDNLVICVPFLASGAITLVVGFVIAILTLLSIFMPFMSHFQENPSAVSPEILMQLTAPAIEQSGSRFLVGILFFILLAVLIRAFFGAGAIGMTKEAYKQKVTILSDMIDYGREKFIDLFLADVIVIAILLAGSLFLVPGFMSARASMAAMAQISPAAPTDIMSSSPFLFGLGFLLMMAYMVIFAMILSLVRYAVVIDDLGALDGVKKGFDMFMENKRDVFLLFLILIVINSIVGLISGNDSPLMILSLILTLAIVRPLSTVWWTHLYIDRAEKG